MAHTSVRIHFLDSWETGDDFAVLAVFDLEVADGDYIDLIVTELSKSHPTAVPEWFREYNPSLSGEGRRIRLGTGPSEVGDSGRWDELSDFSWHLNEDGSVFLPPFGDTGHLTFALARELVREGMMGGDSRYLYVDHIGGVGGDGFEWLDFAAFLYEQGIDLAIDQAKGFLFGIAIYPLSRFVRNGVADRRARAAARRWEESGIQHPTTLRWFVDSKETWEVAKLARRLAVSEEVSRRLLKRLGYVPANSTHWRRSLAPKPQRRRERWIQKESA